MIPIPVCFLELVVLTKNTQFPVQGWQSLEPYKIGIRRGAKIVEVNTKGMKRHVVSQYEQLFKLLDIGRIDIAVTSRVQGLTLIQKFDLEGFKILEPPLKTTNLYHYLHKKHENLVPKITASLQEMEKKGEILKIRQQFINDLIK